MSAPNHSAGSQPAAPKRQLTLFDSTCIIVGIIIGAGIYESTPAIAQHVPGLGWLVAVWLLGGLCSLIGALCYAELATAWPEEGGDYVYLTRAFGHSAGFLFAWAQLWIVRPGSIGAMAYVFARYFDRLLPLSQYLAGAYRSLSPAGAAAGELLKASQQFGESLSLLIYAAGAVVVFSLINIAGVREGKWTQNLLTTAKVLGLGGIFVAGMFFANRQPAAEQPPAEPGAQAAALHQVGRGERFEMPVASRTAQAAQGANAGRHFGASRAGELVHIPPEALPAEPAQTAPPAAAADLASQSESAAAPGGSSDAAQQGESAKQPPAAADDVESGGFTLAMFGMAMIFVLYTYGGWNEMAYVGAEVRNPKKNILRALLLGTVAVTVIYVVVTLAFVNSLGMEGTREPKTTVAEDVLQPLADRLFRLSEKRRALEDELGKLNAALGGADVAGPEADVAQRRAAIQQELAWLDRLGRLPGVGLCVLICISALGAVNGLVFTGARIYYAMGRDHRMYSWLGRWSARRGTPVASLVIQGVITLGLVVGFGLLKVAGLSEGGFHSMVIFTTPAFWFFLVLVGLAVGELRWREPARERPFRVPLYPLTPVLFCLSSLFMLYSSVDYAFKNRSAEILWCVVTLVVGLAACFWDLKSKRGESPGEAE